ncbi:MAG: ABC transporter ATP-binding protein [Solirubrobacterales bacterium]|nr:ABC transporter ATP-binding protein [Solirubrobacterales bacterium]
MLVAELEHRLGSLALDVSLAVGSGDCLALAGPSGAGKTTILRAIAGTLRPNGRRITCDADVWLDSGRGIDRAPEERRCGYVFQDYALFPHLSAWRNVAFSLPRSSRRERARRRTRSLELLESFGIDELAGVPPARMSGGERQRVALARALAREPKVLLLDEPLAALDARARAAAARTLLSTVRSLQVPTLLVTHDFEQAALFANEVSVLDYGVIVQRGSASELTANPASAFVADFTGAVVLSGLARPARGGGTVVELDGGGVIVTSDNANGRVSAIVHPWEITLRRAGTGSQAISTHPAEESAQNQLRVRIVSLTPLGGRVRVGLSAPQALVAEVTAKAVAELKLGIGAEVVAAWKATATRVTPS